MRSLLSSSLALTLGLALACGGIGEPKPEADLAAASTAFGCPGASPSAEQACRLLSDFQQASRPELGTTIAEHEAGYEVWVGSAVEVKQGKLRATTLCSHRKWPTEGNLPYMSFREVWPDDAKERRQLEALIEAASKGSDAESGNAAAIYIRRLDDSVSDFLRLIQKTERSLYLKPPSHGSCGDSCSSAIEAWVRQDGARLILLESAPGYVRVSELYELP